VWAAIAEAAHGRLTGSLGRYTKSKSGNKKAITYLNNHGRTITTPLPQTRGGQVPHTRNGCQCPDHQSKTPIQAWVCVPQYKWNGSNNVRGMGYARRLRGRRHSQHFRYVLSFLLFSFFTIMEMLRAERGSALMEIYLHYEHGNTLLQNDHPYP